jgi:hypothetical protein
LIFFHCDLKFLFPSTHTLSSFSFTLTLYSQVIVVFWSLSMFFLKLLCLVVLLTIHNNYYKESNTTIYHEGPCIPAPCIRSSWVVIFVVLVPNNMTGGFRNLCNKNFHTLYLLFTKYCLGDQIMRGEMDRECSTQGAD